MRSISRGGFTIIELMVVIAILAIVAGTSTLMLGKALDRHARSSAGSVQDLRLRAINSGQPAAAVVDSAGSRGVALPTGLLFIDSVRSNR